MSFLQISYKKKRIKTRGGKTIWAVSGFFAFLLYALTYFSNSPSAITEGERKETSRHFESPKRQLYLSIFAKSIEKVLEFGKERLS